MVQAITSSLIPAFIIIDEKSIDEAFALSNIYFNIILNGIMPDGAIGHLYMPTSTTFMHYNGYVWRCVRASYLYIHFPLLARFGRVSVCVCVCMSVAACIASIISLQ